MGWTSHQGSKFKQGVSVPTWIKKSKKFSTACLRGLFETDGSVYKDRGYTTVNFVTIIPTLVEDVVQMIRDAGFSPNIQTHKPRKGEAKYTIRVSKEAAKFVKTIGISKS